MTRLWRARLAGGAAIVAVIVGTWDGWPWIVTAVVSALLGLYGALEAWESFAADPKVIAFVATLSAVAGIGRVAVQGVPSAQPATFLVMLSGFSLGPVAGTAVGVFTAVGSNLFLGEGGWTPWQMLAWGLVGCTAGVLRRLWPKLPIRWLSAFGLLWGYGFGWIMNSWLWLGGNQHTLSAYLVLCASSLWFDSIHAVTTAGLTWVAGKPVFLMLERFRRRMTVSRHTIS